MTRSPRVLAVAAMLAVALSWPSPAMAQDPGAGPSRFEMAAGAAFLGSADLGTVDATLTPAGGSPALVWFSTGATMVSPRGIDGRVGVRVAPSLVVSGAASIGWADIRVTIDDDSELGRSVELAGERALVARFEGRVDWVLDRLAVGRSRLVPYVTASIGVLQQWHEGYTIKESGRSLLAGGGVRYLFRNRPGGRLSQTALTAELQVCRLSGGYHLGAESRTMPAFGIGVLTGWGKR